MNNREWEKFYGGPLDTYDERVYVTINHKGQIYMNRHTYHLLGAPKQVNFYFSRRRDSIMIVPSHMSLAENFPVKPKQVGYVILASPFCRHYGIRTETTQQFVRPDIDDRKLKLDLTQTITVAVPKRKKSDRGQPARV
jgi:hypothetical protein